MVLSAGGTGAGAPPQSSSGRFVELDGLRGIAAFSVLAYHFTTFVEGDVPPPRLLPSMWWGEYGVQLFFLVSGFVILMSARRAGSVVDFAISRASRLYPVYWLALGVSLTLSLLFTLPSSGIGWADRIANVTMVQRLLLFDNVDPVYWTLAVEVQFYLLVALVMVLARGRITDRAVVSLACAWVAVALVAAVIVRPHTAGLDPQMVAGPWKIVVNVLLVQWAPLFAAGMVCSIARAEGRYRGLAIGLLATGPLIAVIVQDLESGVATAVVCAVFGAVALRRRTPVLRWGVIQFYGRISYSLYIGHLFIGIVSLRFLSPIVGPDLAIVLAIGIVTAVALGYHELGEVRGSRAMRAALTTVRRRLVGDVDGTGVARAA